MNVSYIYLTCITQDSTKLFNLLCLSLKLVQGCLISLGKLNGMPGRSRRVSKNGGGGCGEGGLGQVPVTWPQINGRKWMCLNDV